MNTSKIKRDISINVLSLSLLTTLCLSGCASTYGNLVSGSNLGAQEYQPAVLVNPGMDGKYQEILGLCRSVAVNRQITSAQEAQLKTITGMTSGGISGAVQGMEIGSMFKQAGFGTSINKSMGIGLLGGLMSSAGSAFSSGTENSAAATKRVLLNCLSMADARQQYYKVVE